MKEIKLSFPFIAPSVNRAYYFKRFGKRTIKIKTKDGKDYFEKVKKIVEPLKIEIIKNQIEVYIELVFPDKRKHDVDNYQKLTNDSLTGLIWEDDNQIIKLTTLKKYDYNNPQTNIVIKEYEDNKNEI